MPTTSNMSLVLPTVSVTVGPTWATELNAALTLVDSHDHTSGKGVIITPSAININQDLEFNGNDATELRSVRMESQSAALAGGSDLGCYYNLSGNPTYNNNSGTASRLVNCSYPMVAGDLLYASSTTAFGRLAIGTTGQTLKVSGGLPAWSSQSNTYTVVTKTSGYTISATDDVILCDDSSASFTLNLPVSTGGGKQYLIKKTVSSVNAVTIARASADTISDNTTGLTSTTVNTLGEEVTLLDATAGVWQVIGRRIPGSWNNSLTFTPNSGAFGTITGSSFFSRRTGNTLHVRGYWVNGTVAGGNAYITLPSGYTVDTTYIQGGKQGRIGNLVVPVTGGSTTTAVYHMFFDASDTGKVYPTLTTASNVFEIVGGSQVANSNQAVSVEFWIPISGWNG